ncbi:MAG: hypothetical protein FWG30_06955 [Eubacteriaceae bacterium]|nr:hypothetical protein [Eubacteriaceae bacterium]
MLLLYKANIIALAAVITSSAVFGIYQFFVLKWRDKCYLEEEKMSSELYELTKKSNLNEMAIHFSKKKAAESKALEPLLLSMLERKPKPAKKRWQLQLAQRLGMSSNTVALLSSSSKEKNLLGARKAGIYGYAPAQSALQKLLYKADGQVQLAGLIAIARIGEKESFLNALKILAGRQAFAYCCYLEAFTEYEGDLEEAIHDALLWAGSPICAAALSAVTEENAYALREYITPFVFSKSYEERNAALIALSNSKRGNPYEYFKNALDDSAWQVRATAANLLGRHIYLPAGVFLLHAASDLSWPVRQEAAQSAIAYIEFNEHLLNQFNFRDPYAYDSLCYALEKAGKAELLDKIMQKAGETAKAKVNNIYYITYQTDRNTSIEAPVIDV